MESLESLLEDLCFDVIEKIGESCGVDLDVYLVLIKQICRCMSYIWVKWKTRPNFGFPITTNILELEIKKPDRGQQHHGGLVGLQEEERQIT